MKNAEGRRDTSRKRHKETLGRMAQSTGKGRGKRTVRNISEKGRSPQSKKIEEERSLSKRVKNCDRIIGNI